MNSVHLLFQINRKMVNTIWFRFDLIRILCVYIYCESISVVGAQLRAHLKPLGLSQHYRIGGLKRAFKWSPNMTRDSIVSRPVAVIFFSCRYRTYFSPSGTCAQNRGITAPPYQISAECPIRVTRKVVSSIRAPMIPWDSRFSEAGYARKKNTDSGSQNFINVRC